MYKIGKFSSMYKTTIKTLRYYETSQLVELSKIISLRQIGLSIKHIKNILNGFDMETILDNRKKDLEENISLLNTQLSKVNYLLDGKIWKAK